MKRPLLLFGGTTEGRRLAENLADPYAVTVCVATEYGKEVLPRQGVTVLTGYKDVDEMIEVMNSEPFAVVVDATHPYARQASENIRAAANRISLPYLRLLRGAFESDDSLFVHSVEEAVEALKKTTGPVMIATGSKELDKFTALPDYAQKLYPRVLPTVESIQKCESLGFLRSHIIALYGPFGTELNLALIRQFSIKTLVTKDSGPEGGFPQKQQAASQSNTQLIVIGRPEKEQGFSYNEILSEIQKTVGE